MSSPVELGYGPAEKRSDPDDIQSMVRFLLYSNDLEVEGLVASSGTYANIANKSNIHDILNLYDQVDENLRKHDPRYPTADQLRSVTWEGRSGNWGKPANDIIGEGKDSEASEAIIKIIDREDSRPVWIGFWGGPQEGDTPSFLHLVSAMQGMNDPVKPGQESWGGQYEQRDPTKNHWYDGPGAVSVSKWLDDIQADFAIRADWMVP